MTLAIQTSASWGKLATNSTDMAVATMEKMYLGTTTKKGMNTCTFGQNE
jgi:hypothetical protein